MEVSLYMKALTGHEPFCGRHDAGLERARSASSQAEATALGPPVEWTPLDPVRFLLIFSFRQRIPHCLSTHPLTVGFYSLGSLFECSRDLLQY